MVIKLYISGISGNKEVKKKQQRVQMILDSKQINYEAIDITEPGKEKDKEFMQQNGKVRESLGKYPLPPQIFNDADFCGDYEDFDMANEVDELEKFLHIEINSKDMENGSKNDEKSEGINKGFYDKNKDSTDSLYNPYEYHTFTIKCDSVNGLKEEITNNNSLGGEKEQTEEVTKSEVNGESEVIPTLEPSNESITENVEISGDGVLAPEKEESTAKETAAENEEEENAGHDEDKEREVLEMPEKEKEEEEKEEEKEEDEKSEDFENDKEDKVESSEKSPLLEEEEEEEEVAENTEKGKIATEGEDEEQGESDRESPESEKLQNE